MKDESYNLHLADNIGHYNQVINRVAFNTEILIIKIKKRSQF